MKFDISGAYMRIIPFLILCMVIPCTVVACATPKGECLEYDVREVHKRETIPGTMVSVTTTEWVPFCTKRADVVEEVQTSHEHALKNDDVPSQ